MPAPETPPQKGILIVDNDADIREIAASCLKRLGFSAHTVSDGELALKALERGGFGLVFLDVRVDSFSVLHIFFHTDDVLALQSLGDGSVHTPPRPGLGHFGQGVEAHLDGGSLLGAFGFALGATAESFLQCLNRVGYRGLLAGFKQVVIGRQ